MQERLSVEHYIGKGNNHFVDGDLDKALMCYRRALALDRDCAVAYYNIANILAIQSKFRVAERHYREALAIVPQWPEALNNLANVLKEQGKITEAGDCYKRALELNPALADAYNGLGILYQVESRIEEAIEAYKEALRLNPNHTIAHSNLLLALNYSDRFSQNYIFEEHKRYGDRLRQLYNCLKPHNALSYPVDRKIRIGYVSPDFRRHSVGYFIAPVLEHHSRDRFYVVCYSDVVNPDSVTMRLRGYVDKWVNTGTITDLDLAREIAKDQIDILIDLAGHSGYNRLSVFAMRPATVQISWLGYPNTTGLEEVDFRIVDPLTDPVGITDQFYTEKLLRMPKAFLCYEPPEDAPKVQKPPCISNKFVTFGSLNNIAKMSETTLRVWTEVLKNCEGSRLLLKSKVLNDSTVRQRLLRRFASYGIAEERIITITYKQTFSEHLDTYNQIDIALDTFPYNGTTTTFEALFMGTPVITLAGNCHASRVGLSILTNLGLRELIAYNEKDFIEKAINLHRNVQAIADFKGVLRNRLVESPLCDKVGFTRDFEGLLIEALKGHSGRLGDQTAL